MNDDTTVTDDPTGPMQQVNGAEQDEGKGAGPPSRAAGSAPAGFAELPEVELPAPEGRTEFSEPPKFGLTESGSSSGSPDDDWRPADRPVRDEDDGPVTVPAAPESEPMPVSSWFERPDTPAAPQEEWDGPPAGRDEPGTERAGEGSPEPLREVAAGSRTEAPAGPSGGEPDDVRVAPVVAAGPAGPDGSGGERSGWEGSLFDGPGEGDGEGVPGYAPVDISRSSTPPKPGKPSSGNWQMPDWIHEEEQRARQGGGTPSDAGFEEGGRSRVALFAGVGVLVVALAAVGGFFYVKRGGDSTTAPDTPSAPPATQGLPAERDTPPKPRVNLPPDKAMPRFAGTPSRAVGMVADRRSGLAYPRFAAPWQLPTKKNRLGTAGWSGQQVAVTERNGARVWYGQLLTGVLQPSLAGEFKGPRSLKRVTVMARDGLVEQYYAFPHKERPLASQPLNVGGRKGWLVSSYLTYQRPGIKATGEVVAVAVIDTGRDVPAVVFASMPNTHRKLWPDVNAFINRLKPAASPAE
ncbi:hypothetical protein SAMN04489712_102592 [Thermomonospora echinospora]|uniref:Uncharacterized protein n=2 Tax=Thermomonospora echinospora TaxID=1992 RepID=A0A1H5W5K0_9ACTN|nr:hypothetical protein SAMN04489712_102592 [Thermomonospora echinospora]